jgi:uncharacterized protein YjiS (DUF1127 family)
MEQRQELANLLRAIADWIEQSPSAEVEEFLADGQIPRLSRFGSQRVNRDSRLRQGSAKKKGAARIDQDELSELPDRLRKLVSREEGMDLLDSLGLTRKDLERLARYMDLPVLREDDAARLRSKIVEASIGSRLNSQAIRGA